MRFSNSAGSRVGATHWPMPGIAAPAFLTRLCRKSKPGTILAKPLPSFIVSPRERSSLAFSASAPIRGSATEIALLDLVAALLHQGGQAVRSDHVQAAYGGEHLLPAAVQHVDARGQARVAVVEHALHGRPLAAGAQAVAPLGVIRQLGVVAFDPDPRDAV